MPEFLSDWRFYLFVVTILGSVINFLASFKIMTNHLTHIDKKLDVMDKKIDHLEENYKESDKEIAVLKEKTKNF